MSAICGFLISVLIIAIPVMSIVWLIRFLMKKPCKKLGKIILFCLAAIIPLTIIGVLTDPATWCEHEYAIIEEVDSTCITEGKIVKKCSLCDNEDVKIKDKLSHEWVTDKLKDATCTEQGKITKKCSLCSKEEIEYTEKLPHEWVTEQVEDATCTEQGRNIKKCSLCGGETVEYTDTISHSWETNSVVSATCESDGYTIKKCSICFTTQKTNITNALGHSMKEVSRTEETNEENAKIYYECTRCGLENVETIVNPNPKGSEANPYTLKSDTWYAEHCAGTSQRNYLDKWVKITGTVLNISDYGSLKGYYLAGGTGKGLVCWVNSNELKAQYGQVVEYIGKVSIQDPTHIEITDGKITSAEWPAEKPKSPITISDWSWSRDFLGGVEWSFRLTNNTDKVVKYISMQWNCYNAVGDLVYDEISGDSNHGVKYTGPLNPEETTDYLCTSSRFYNYSFSTSKFTFLQVEFMDGTIIRITDKAYTDYYIQKLESETVIGSNGIKYIVNNNLNTCYIADIGTCKDTYIAILTSLYSDTVTAIGDYAFADATFIEKVSITYALERIGVGAFQNCSSLTYINYYGTIEDWNNIEKGSNWDKGTGDYIVHCNDGQIAKDGTVIYN